MILRTQAAALRALTAHVLRAQNTIAGDSVEEERTLPLADGELPHLNVFMDESGEAHYQGGPVFMVTGKLQIKGTVQRARLEDALSDLDALAYQIKDALFGEAAWIVMSNQMLSYSATATFKSDDNQHHAELLVVIPCQWRETIAIRGPVPLTSETISLTVPTA